MIEHVYLIPLIPLAASIIILLGAPEDPRSPMPFLGIAATGWCLFQSLAIFHGIAAGAVALPYTAQWNWFTFAAESGGKAFAYDMPIGVLIDGPAAMMLVVVTLVSFLVQIYSLSYMHDDPRFKRYYAYLSFFTASMLGLVVSSNLLVTFCCWELVGFSSYILIGFWFERPEPAYACKKAFITTKLGDLGLYVALLLIFVLVGSFQIQQIAEFVARGYMPAAAATAIGLGILCGAAGKSAQFPLLIWLPDAMEGPTPVSALIHAATMVAAGIYLVARCYFIYAASPVAMQSVAWLGAVTAFLAATMAVACYDIKRVLAFSTVSQLGFMMCALGAWGFTAGLFHLTTHACFKALLFLCAGSVIHAVHTNDMRQMGGLSKKMPLTFLATFVGTCAIAGIPLLSGWFSKEMILEKVYESEPNLFLVLAATACLTAFYMFRLVFLTFLGSERDRERHHHAHESSPAMLVPLGVLAVLSIFAGGLLEHHGFFERLAHFEAPPVLAGFQPPIHVVPHGLGWVVTALVFAAIALAWCLYRGPDFRAAEALKARLQPLFTLLERRYYLDDIFLGLVCLADRVAALCFRIDSEIIDRIFVDGWGLVMRILAEISHACDALFIDRAVDATGSLSVGVGGALRWLVRRGLVQEYLMYAAVGASLFAVLTLYR
ncbi:MAG TPA: NADH-quinone oxidoreductase subunit L [Elusimicrobia bacterium]|nr:NADH-quinone oxidoreductase subunit L [Elusimicrobiota bacterium]HBT61728.1 NADH-quinone oxidoreductase subunit L [Elusimicrobiota bacterium]